MADTRGFLSRVWDQINIFDDGRSYGNPGKSSPKPPSPPPMPKPTNLTPATVPGANDNSQFLKGLNAQIAALQQQLAYQPKLPSFDISGNYARARTQAEAAVNPLYDKYLKDFLAQQQVRQQNKQQEVGIAKESIAQELQQNLGQSAVDRTRVGEDTATAIEDLTRSEANFQRASGTQFDTDRRALAETNAAAGLTTSGIGQGRMYDQNIMRNLDEGQQVQEYGNQREAKKLFETRTIEDLARGDENARAVSTNKTKGVDFDLESYMDELAADETNFRNENEYKRLSDVSTQSQSYANAGTQSFLSSLAGAGWRPQDIALAYQVYG